MLKKQLFIISLLFGVISSAMAADPVKLYGQLQVNGNQLCSEQGEPVVLRGVSYGWHNLWPRFYNKKSVKWLKEDWKCTVLRAAMGTCIEDNYIENPEHALNCINAVVKAAIKNNVYVIIDWHTYYPQKEEAKAFFSMMAQKYGKYPHVIYEIYNEPMEDTWESVKEYATDIITQIRKYDPDNIILVGSPHWDQDLHLVAADPLQGFNNIMYTLHFYAATHKQELRDRATAAWEQGIPIFVSECAGMECTGDGPLDIEEWTRWVEWMEAHKISWVNWSISDKNETCSMLLPRADKNGGWDESLIKPVAKAASLYGNITRLYIAQRKRRNNIKIRLLILNLLQMKRNLFSFPRSQMVGKMLRAMSFVVAVFWATTAMADIVVKGVVADDSGLPIPGANVTELNSKGNGTITNVDGQYSIVVKGPKSVLRFSFIGYTKEDVTVGNKTQIDVQLSEDSKSLDEVVVIGYGTMRKKDLSGAVASIKSEDLMIGNPTSFSQALQGKLAGVQVNSNDGAPGSGMSITIRGANSFSTSSQPLYIVDGIPFDAGSAPTSGANENNNTTSNPLSLINPNDIESIDVLKDASATAIYGSRGANGVVLITTKKGKSGAAKVEFSANFGLSKISKIVESLNAYEYANFVNEATINNALYDNTPYAYLPYRGDWNYRRDPQNNIIPESGTYEPAPEDFLNPGWHEDEYGNREWVEGTNWLDEILQDAFTQEYNISVSGGNDKSHYAFSGNYTDQTGIIRNSGYDRLAVRANVGSQVKSWLNTGLNINFTKSNTRFAKSNSYDYSIIRSAMLYPPTIYVGDHTQDDEYFWLSANPRTYVNTAKDELKSINVFTSAFLEIKFTDWLRFRQNFGMSYTDNERSTYYPRETGEGKNYNGRAGKSDNFYQNITAESVLTFDKTFADIHHLNVVAGFTYENTNWGGKAINASNFPTDITEDYNLSQALTIDAPTSNRGEATLVSLLGRANYVLKDRYIFTASYRRDGSSRFAPGNKFANFASGAVAWVLSEEDFIKNLNIFSNLKLRASYGQTGNQGINSYQTMVSLGSANYPFGGITDSGFAGDTSKGPLNKDLKWETTDQYNVGLDFGFLKNRIALSVNYYYKKTRDLLQYVSIPSSTGFSNMWTNFGHVTNEGIELTGQFYAIDTKDWGLDFDANIAFNRNRIGGLTADQYANNLWYSAKEVFIQRNGLPIGAILGYVEDGFYDNLAEVRADPLYANVSDVEAQRMVGEIKYLDVNGDGKLTTEDRAIIGDTNPDFTYGLTGNFRWKNLTLSMFFQGTYGNDIFNANLTNISMQSVSNIPKFAYESRWTPDNTENAKWPRATMAQTREWRISDRHVEDGSYLKLKTINLAYNFGSPCKGIENVTVFGTVNNVFTITGYSWYDPDVNTFGQDASRRGVDIYSYPASRTFSLGVKVTL